MGTNHSNRKNKQKPTPGKTENPILGIYVSLEIKFNFFPVDRILWTA